MTTPVFEAEYDLLVIGGGAAGKSAAYEGALQGLDVGLLEKAPQTGGSSVNAEGQAAFESSEQKARGVPPTPGSHYPTKAEGYQRYMDYSSKRAKPEVVRMQVNNTAETIDIMKGLGIHYTDVTIYAYDQPAELNTFHRPEGLGALMQETLLKACVDAGVDIFTNTAGTGLILDGQKVIGVEATDADGNNIKVGAKAVVLAAGGFGGNRDMVNRYGRFKNSAYLSYMGPEENTGDGINMAIAAGASTWEMGVLMIIPVARDKTLVSHISGAGSQPVLWVDTSGQRYWDEKVALSFADAGNVIASAPECKHYSIMDAATVRHLVENGSDIGLGDFIKYHLKLTNLPTELSEAIAEGKMAWQGETIEELAANIGLPPATLQATIDRYNGFCAAGEDLDFFKDPRVLRPVRQAPFYAIEMTAAILVSCGALSVNGDLQVINTDGQPIAGLYAAGVEAGGLFGDAYNLDVPGTMNGFSHASGRVAARHAAKLIKG